MKEVMKMTKYMSETVKRNEGTKHLISGPRGNTGRENKTIGVEIEFFGVHYQRVVDAMNAAGIRTVWGRYTHEVMAHWKVVTDSSVTSVGTGTGNGLEIVSPPLTEEGMTEELKKVCEVLEQIGARVDRTCGVHVHHDIDDLTVENVKNIYKIYDKHQLAIESIIPQSRRGTAMNRYCRQITDMMMNELENLTTIESVARKFSRFHTVNMQSYLRYGTV